MKLLLPTIALGAVAMFALPAGAQVHIYSGQYPVLPTQSVPTSQYAVRTLPALIMRDYDPNLIYAPPLVHHRGLPEENFTPYD